MSSSDWISRRARQLVQAQAEGADPFFSEHRLLLSRTQMGQTVRGRDGRPGHIVLIDALDGEKMRIVLEHENGDLSELQAKGSPLRWQ